ncbi:MAG: cytochrome c biogenesis protein CcsA [Thermodesulfobacteriota bacterium]|jgi:cytochrome c-type biogenesis protein CcsB
MDWSWIVVLSYFLSSIFYGSHFWTKGRNLSKLGFYFIVLGAALQTISLIYVYTRGNPLAQGFDTTLYLFAWFISLVYIASQIKFKASLLGAFAAPLAFIMTLPHIILPQGIIEHNATLSNPWILIHIALILLGEALFTVAFISGILYLFQENKIKSKHVGSFLEKFPSLTTLDRINHLCLIIGFPLVTIGIALGLLLAKEIWGASWEWGQKETWSLVTWFLYAVLIHGRLASGWKGRKAALGAVLGFGIILFTLFVIGYLAPGQHDFLGQ